MPATVLHPADLALLPVELADDGCTGALELGPGLLRHDGALYGGTGLALSILAMEAATGREVLWASTQFVATAHRGDRIEWTTQVLAHGKRASQVLVQARVGTTPLLTTIGSTGVGADDGLTGQWAPMPTVPGPDDCNAREGFAAFEQPDSYTRHIELRDAPVQQADVHAAIWVRRRDGAPMTPAGIGFSADFVPLAVARAAHKLGAGSSLDNSVRLHGGEGTAWVLLELVGDFAHGGFGHGQVRVWGQDGALLATGSQTAAMKYLWNEDELPRLPGPLADRPAP